MGPADVGGVSGLRQTSGRKHMFVGDEQRIVKLKIKKPDSKLPNRLIVNKGPKIMYSDHKLSYRSYWDKA